MIDRLQQQLCAKQYRFDPVRRVDIPKPKVGELYQGQVRPTSVGVPQGSPISPLYSNIYLNLLDQLWHKRGYPEKLGASLHRYADDAILVCRKSAYPALEAFEAIARRM